jgi:uncharacterized protein YlxW (UPF0749 family)
LKKYIGRPEIAMICAIIGIMLATQLQSIGNMGGLVSSQRADQLLIELNNLKKKNEELTTKSNLLEEEINGFESEASTNNRYIEKLLSDVNNAKLYSGQTEVKGPGIVITLNYESVENDGFDPFLYNSELLLLMVNELNAAGAEAISINGERLISTSEIRLAGSHININGNKHTRPFVFKVVGDTKTLRSAMLIRAGIADIMRANYISVALEDAQELTVEPYKGVIEYRYAKPVGRN